jgi:hypothetical protein
MKQFFLLITLFAVSCYSQSDITVTVKSGFSPETKYITQTKQFNNGTVQYIASEDILQRLKERGVPNPMPIETEMAFKTILKTGKLKKDGFFPLTLLFVDKGEILKELPDDMVIYGRGTNGKLPVLDSISSAKMAMNEKSMLLNQMQSIFTQLSIPEKTVKVGESFSFDMPLSIPMAGKNIEMVIKCTYNLKKVTGDIAEFDITTEYFLKDKMESSETEIKGNGKGKLLYNRKLNINENYEVHSDIEMSITMDQLKLYAKLSQGSIISVTSEKNNQ